MNNHTKRQRGFSLIELMVGLVIGLIATLVIMQVYATFEGQKRSTTGGADAQTNGALALYAMQRDAGNAGFGLPVADSTASALNCPVGTTIDPDGAGTIPALDIFPVSIVDGGVAAGNSDSIAFRFGASAFNMGTATTKISGISGATVAVANSLACSAGNIAFVINGGLACNSATVPAIPDATHVTFSALPAAAIVGANLACLGAPTTATVPGAWNQNVYSIGTGTLVNQLVVSQNGAAATPIASDIVTMQAQYGISATATSDTITQWVDATAASGWAAPLTLTNRNRIKAIRVAVVARNGQLEKANVTQVCSSLTAAAPTGLCAWAGTVNSPAPSLDLSNDANWQRYRYRVFNVIVPLRSMIWSGGN
jgi:type IV pilus assembly protein PilW